MKHGPITSKLVALGLMSLCVACRDDVSALFPVLTETDTFGLETTTGVPPWPTPPSTSGTGSGEADDGSSSTTMSAESGTGPDAPVRLDILFVVDNSPRTAAAQVELALTAEALIDGLYATSRDLRVKIMVTTSDASNELCAIFKPDGYAPAMGAPVSTACSTRLEDFTELGSNPESVPEACTFLCPEDVAPYGDFLVFGALTDNVLDGTPTDALRCLIPQGLNGCWFEAPLEAMYQALDPSQCWNDESCTNGPFLGPPADLAIVMLTDELDCSVANYELWIDESYQNDNPNSGSPQPSSAICFNAGVSCNGPGPDGTYSDCLSTDNGTLHPVSRYIDRLAEAQAAGRRVHFVALTGVDPDGGLSGTTYRSWRDGVWPTGDITPPEFAVGLSAEDQAFNFGLGPGCTALGAIGGYTQALPPVRIAEVCAAVEADGGSCCMESVCGDSYVPALECLLDGLR